ncbi:Hypothetical predicted protein [Octopus vulgaris]|uniref:Reverse transcriptase domain-containing protein n=1 Tax=Octopus vulgaris TaxID=6645 RepID=A0AA36EZB1_OCTVU|nr:Hypothetical predicted protein [Octopus vulgaris]
MVFVSRLLLEKCREQQRDASFAFIDLKLLILLAAQYYGMNVLQKCLVVLLQFHDGMELRVTLVGDQSDYFNVQVGVKQGYVLAPVLFNVFLVAVTLLSRYDFNPEDSIPIRYRHDGSLFNLRRLKSLTKIQSTTLFELQNADDCEALAYEPTRRMSPTTLDVV